MKGWIWLILIVLPISTINPKPYCNFDTLHKEKNILQKYKILQTQKKCNVKNNEFLELTKQAYLSGDYSIGIWAAESVIKKNKTGSIEKLIEFYYYLGISYLGKKRTEEAIETLKKIVFYNDVNKLDQEFLQKSHMALIQAYYESKRDKRKEKNISYLIKLFKSRHKKSELVYALHNWNNNRYSE